jgi:hypothetical protein
MPGSKFLRFLCGCRSPAYRKQIRSKRGGGLEIRIDQGADKQRRPSMRESLRPEERFPDIELPNQDGEATKLSGLMGGFPIIVVFSRGYY